MAFRTSPVTSSCYAALLCGGRHSESGNASDQEKEGGGDLLFDRVDNNDDSMLRGTYGIYCLHERNVIRDF